MPFCPFRPPNANELSLCPESRVGDLGCFLWGTGSPIRAGGNIYSKTMTMTDDNVTRFESSIKTLRDVIIAVKSNAMLLGETGAEVFPVAAGGNIGWTKVDISTLYFKNETEGNNGKITILGVED